MKCAARLCGGFRQLASWSFLTNHALVLIHVGRQPESTGVEIAQAVRITERAVRKILAELQGEAYVATERVGRRNRYRVDVHRPLRRVAERELTAGELLAFIPGGQGPAAADGLSSGRRPETHTADACGEPNREAATEHPSGSAGRPMGRYRFAGTAFGEPRHCINIAGLRDITQR